MKETSFFFAMNYVRIRIESNKEIIDFVVTSESSIGRGRESSIYLSDSNFT